MGFPLGWLKARAAMIENYAVYFALAGLALLVVGWLWMADSAFRHRAILGMAVLLVPPAAPVYGLWRRGKAWGPLVVMGLGLALAAFPPVYYLLTPIDLGPRDKIVDGERHVTLTGWDRSDYSVLGAIPDVVVLQMANPDVTDDVLKSLRGLDRLRELDLNDTAITDAGLMVLKDLPALESLRLKNTRITDAGFRGALAEKESLKRLDLTGTSVERETVDAWRKAGPGRRAMR